MKKLFLFVFIGVLALTTEVKAQFLTGGVLASQGNFTSPSSSVTASSVTLIMTNIIDSTYFPPSGLGPNSFYTLVPSNSLLFAYSSTVSGLSSTPTAISINDFFVFSYPEPGFGPSTTPPNRFDFDLLTIADSYTGNANNTATITGTGTIVDTTGAFQNTPGEFTIDFEHPNQYTITLQAVPEPTTVSLVVAGLLGALAFRPRKT
jgi:hypothetical protein